MKIAPATILILLAGAACGSAGEVFDDFTLRFTDQLDARALSVLPVQYSGRVAVLDTLARDQLSQMYGSEHIDGAEPAPAYLELYFNAGQYLGRPVLRVREEKMRAFLAGRMDDQAKAEFLRTGRLPPMCLVDQKAIGLLWRTGRATEDDFIRAGQTPSLRGALQEVARYSEFRVPLDRLSARYSAFLAMDVLRVVPCGERWVAPLDLPASATGPAPPPELVAKFAAIRDAWRARDAAAVNALVKEFASMQASAAPNDVPGAFLARLELLYNRAYKTTIAWVGFALAMVLFIAAAASGRRWARLAGMGVLGASTAALLAGFVGRWVLSGRAWYLPPIMNQFEAVSGSALLAAVLAIVLELFWKRNYFALAAAFYATVSLLCGFFLPEQMGVGISAQPGILASPIMAVHVAVIIVGHAMAGMTFVVSYVYLLAAALHGAGAGRRQLVLIPQAAAWLAFVVALVLGVRSTLALASTDWQVVLYSIAGGAFAAMLVHVAVLAATGGRRPAAAISDSPDLTGRPEGTLATIDRGNLIISQLACWTVALGTILGAYWGDFAWGRWWGWDPKETWALITAMVYVGVLHLRFAVSPRRRGLVTAVGCIIGCLVMLFNWIVINHFIRGKHSYA